MKFVYRAEALMTESRVKDVNQIREYLATVLDIEASFLDVYFLWQAISHAEGETWLPADYVGDAYESRVDFIISGMSRFGYIV